MKRSHLSNVPAERIPFFKYTWYSSAGNRLWVLLDSVVSSSLTCQACRELSELGNCHGSQPFRLKKQRVPPNHVIFFHSWLELEVKVVLSVCFCLHGIVVDFAPWKSVKEEEEVVDAGTGNVPFRFDNANINNRPIRSPCVVRSCFLLFLL